MNNITDEFLKEVKDNFMKSSREKFKEQAKNSYEAKLIAIEFAKYILNQKITKQTPGCIGNIGSSATAYHPVEFKLMLGELIKNEDGVFKEFLNSVIYE